MPSPLGHGLAGLAIGIVGGLNQPGERRTSLARAGLLLGSRLRSRFRFAGTRCSSHRLSQPSCCCGGVRRWQFAVGSTWVLRALAPWLRLPPRPSAATWFSTGWVRIPGCPRVSRFWPAAGWYVSGWDVFPPTTRHDVLSVRSLWINTRAAVWEVFILGGDGARRAAGQTLLPAPKTGSILAVGPADRCWSWQRHG